MCKKLIILCAALVLAGWSMPASASTISGHHALMVDINNGSGFPPPICTGQEWQLWEFPGWTKWINPSKTFNIGCGTPPDWPTAQLTSMQNDGSVGNGDARPRSHGIVFVPKPVGTAGFGMNYIKLTLTNLNPNGTYRVQLWSYEQLNVWQDAGNPQIGTKYGVWSVVNPKAWLEANGYSGQNGDPCGYGPAGEYHCTDESGMPEALAAIALGPGKGDRTYMEAPATPAPIEVPGTVGAHAFKACVTVTADAQGVIALYGWIDPTTNTGSMHMPLNAFMVTPEPTTVALLGLGGLALLRRKR